MQADSPVRSVAPLSGPRTRSSPPLDTDVGWFGGAECPRFARKASTSRTVSGCAHLMLLRTPVDTHDPSCLQREPPRLASRTGAPTMPADPCTGALRRRLPTGHPSMAGCRGTSPKEVLDAQGDFGSSRQPARLHATNRARPFRRYRVTAAADRAGSSYGPARRLALVPRNRMRGAWSERHELPVDDSLRQRQSRRGAGRTEHRRAASRRRRSAVGRPPSAGRGRGRGRGCATTGTCHG